MDKMKRLTPSMLVGTKPIAVQFNLSLVLISFSTFMDQTNILRTGE
jgi:hypothetical protein